MENILILDTETTGLDPAKGKLLEVAVILFNIPTRTVIHQISTLLHADTNEAEEINKIPVEALKRVIIGLDSDSLLLTQKMMIIADAIIAHNAEFDKKWLETNPIIYPVSKDKKWICTKNDVKWPIRKGAGLRLIDICVELDIPIINHHRALSDCELLLKCINKMPDIVAFLDKSKVGLNLYHADISYDQRQLAKDHGFLWDNIKKVWYANLSFSEAENIPFAICIQN